MFYNIKLLCKVGEVFLGMDYMSSTPNIAMLFYSIDAYRYVCQSKLLANDVGRKK